MVPVGFVPLVAALDMVGRRLYRASWYPFSAGPLDPLDLVRDVDAIDAESITATLNAFEHVITLIAKRAASGELPCVRFTDIGDVESLDLSVWRLPGWRDYFITGKVTLTVPLRDERGKVVPLRDEKGNLSESTTRGTFDIFVEREGLERLIAAALPAEPSAGTTKARPRRTKRISEIVTAYRKSLSDMDNPSIEAVTQFARRQEGLIGHRNELRAEYHRQFPNQRRGRPSK
jgi:hypothetical protein